MLLNDGRSISQNVASLNTLAHDVIKLLLYTMDTEQARENNFLHN